MSEWPQRTGLIFQRLGIRMVAEQSARLPAYKGSMLRGALGWGLRRVACLTRRFDCPGCPVAERCLYAELFEPKGHGPLKGLEEAPRLYVVEPPLERQQDYGPGQSLEWHLVLIGPAARALPYVVLALDQVGVRGLGPRRAPFRLVDVKAADGTAVYVPGRPDRWRLTPRELSDADVALAHAFEPGAPVVLEFLTPTRLVANGRLVDQPTPEAVVAALLRRIAALRWRQGLGSSGLPDPKLMDAARRVKVLGRSIRWDPVRRYSTRQRQTLSLGGFTGTVVLGDVPPELFMPLAWGAVLHVGKGTVFGLGRYRMSTRA